MDEESRLSLEAKMWGRKEGRTAYGRGWIQRGKKCPRRRPAEPVMSWGLDAGHSILETPRDLPGWSANTPLEAGTAIKQSPGTRWPHCNRPDVFPHGIERVVVNTSMCTGDVTQAPSTQAGLQNHHAMGCPLGRWSLEHPLHLAKFIEAFPYVCVWHMCICGPCLHMYTCAHVCGSHSCYQPSFWAIHHFIY